MRQNIDIYKLIKCSCFNTLFTDAVNVINYTVYYRYLQINNIAT